MDTNLQPADLKLFRNELADLCRKYNVTDLVTLLSYKERYTAVLQYTATDCSVEMFNSVRDQLCQQLQNIESKIKKQN